MSYYASKSAADWELNEFKTMQVQVPTDPNTQLSVKDRELFKNEQTIYSHEVPGRQI